MYRFSIRDMLWLTIVVGVSVGWCLDRSKLADTASEAQDQAAETERERAKWEGMTQMGAAAHNKTLRVIEESGLVIVSNGGKSRLEEKRERRAGFNPP